jgi:hypothetical protein
VTEPAANRKDEQRDGADADETILNARITFACRYVVFCGVQAYHEGRVNGHVFLLAEGRRAAKARRR